jgi:hypothetical protein
MALSPKDRGRDPLLQKHPQQHGTQQQAICHEWPHANAFDQFQEEMNT